MRPVHLSDLHFAAVALQRVAHADRRQVFAVAVNHADIADQYRKRLGRAHPEYGLGTLTSALGLSLIHI